MNELRATTATGDGDLWRVAVVRNFANSALFDRTFQQGMELVEQTAAYLDGAGRQECRHFDRKAALDYSNESMRLTTRLMHVASWLLVLRAVREGAMQPLTACEICYRLDRTARAGEVSSTWLPSGLIDLTDRAEQLYERVKHLDQRMYLDGPPEPEPQGVLSQLMRLDEAFTR